MDSRVWYPVVVLVAGAVTALATVDTTSTELLVGIFVIYAATGAIVLRYPFLVWGREVPAAPSGVFGGGATFGGLTLAHAFGPDFHLGAALLGLGLAGFGFASGYWLADAEREEEASTDSTVPE